MDKPPNRRAERNDFMTVVFPVLISEIAKRGIKRKDIAGCLGICEKTLKQKLDGITEFTWREVKEVSTHFFPDIPLVNLFGESDHVLEGGILSASIDKVSVVDLEKKVELAVITNNSIITATDSIVVKLTPVHG